MIFCLSATHCQGGDEKNRQCTVVDIHLYSSQSRIPLPNCLSCKITSNINISQFPLPPIFIVKGSCRITAISLPWDSETMSLTGPNAVDHIRYFFNKAQTPPYMCKNIHIKCDPYYILEKILVLICKLRRIFDLCIEYIMRK